MKEPKPLTVRFLVAIQYDYYDTDTPTLKRILQEGWRQKIQATLQPQLYPGLKLDVQVSGNPDEIRPLKQSTATTRKMRAQQPRG